jgi:hypothetical protein
MVPPRVVEEAAVGAVERRRPGQHERHVDPVGGQPIEQVAGVCRAANGLDPVVAGVALGEVALEVREGARIVAAGRDDDG